jgi:hypothetical protein
VHSRNDETICGLGIDIRVDQHLPFIDGFIAAHDQVQLQCLSDGRCTAGCLDADPDCHCARDHRCDLACGLTDPDCADDGASCTAATTCLGGACLDGGMDAGFCSRACSATSVCAAGFSCQQAYCRPTTHPDAGSADDAGAGDAGPGDAGEPVMTDGGAPTAGPPACGCTTLPPLSLLLVAALLPRRRR